MSRLLLLLLSLWSEVLKIPKYKGSNKWHQLFHDRGSYHIETGLVSI